LVIFLAELFQLNRRQAVLATCQTLCLFIYSRESFLKYQDVGPNYYRIQVKTIDAKSEGQYMENRWKESNVDCLIYFARNSNLGFVIPVFTQNRKKLNAEGHVKFEQTKKDFLKAFHKV